MSQKADRGTRARATPATLQLTRAGVAFTLHPYEHDPAAPSYGLEAAAALGVAPERVFKTLMSVVDGRMTVAVVPVHRRLDLKALATAAGGKRADLADPALAERVTGYVVGGISPFGQRRPSPTVVDASAFDHDTVLVSGGRRGLDIEVSPHDLVRLTGGRAAPIARTP